MTLKKLIRRLPDSELAVMQAVWECTPPVSRTALEEKLLPTYPMAQTTLLTLLTRLAQKGFLTIEKQGRANFYLPTVTRDAYLADQSRRFVDQLCGGSISLFASALCDSGLSRDELEQLRKLLEEGGL
jgi:predicted transcriptional regulator